MEVRDIIGEGDFQKLTRVAPYTFSVAVKKIDAVLQEMTYAHAYRTRNSDPQTSADAAKSISPEKITEIQGRVMSLLREGGKTDEELLNSYVSDFGYCSESTPRKRRKELTDAGLVIDTGEKRVGSSGRKMIVWSVK